MKNLISMQATVKAKLREGASSIRYKVPEDIEKKWERIDCLSRHP